MWVHFKQMCTASERRTRPIAVNAETAEKQEATCEPSERHHASDDRGGRLGSDCRSEMPQEAIS